MIWVKGDGCMYEQHEAVQKMINWLEGNLSESPLLFTMSRQIGYSPCYCSSQFHAIVGTTLKTYVAGRRLSKAAQDIRDTNMRIIDIAMKYGFSSQQALTRAFVLAYRCTPAAYRKSPSPVPFRSKKAVLFPEYYPQKGDANMNKTILTEANVRTIFIPAHKYLCIRDSKVQAYYPFWEGKDCDTICGTIDSMSHVAHPILGCHTAGWFYENGNKGYSYGLGLPLDYSGEIPDGFEVYEYPDSYYLMFYHPPFDFLKDCAEVMRRVENLAWSFDPATKGFAWNENLLQDYQIVWPETIGYELLRPVTKL